MRGFLVLFMVLSGCQDDFTIGDVDAAGFDANEADAGGDVPGIDAGNDAALPDASLADVASDTAPDVIEVSDSGPDTMRPANTIRVLPHQVRLLDGFYEMNVLFAVMSGPPLNTAPTNLLLRFDGGVEVGGVPFERPAANLKCSDDLRVTDARGTLCRVSFPAPAGVGVPVELVFVENGIRYTSILASCSAGAIIGRCDEGFMCIGGDCLPACAPHLPAGSCFLQESCSEGACVADCSVFSPEGYCRSGTCMDGACVES